MISNQTFKESMSTMGRILDFQGDLNNVHFDKEDFNQIEMSYEGRLFATLMKGMTIELNGLYDQTSNDIFHNLKLGVKAGEFDDYSYITYGTYVSMNDDYEQSIDMNSTTFHCYDLMVKSMIPYDLDIDYPISVTDYLKAICTRLNYTLATEEGIVNGEMLIEEEKYDESYTFREVLDEIAQVTASMICFKNDDKLYLLYPHETNSTIDENTLKSLTINATYGPVNNVVLSRTPQEDNIYMKDSASEEANGLCEVKFENNQIMDKRREEYIEAIFNSVKDFTFSTFELDSFGLCLYEPYDVVYLKNLEGNVYKTVILSNTMTISQGITESLYTEYPTMTNTDYKKADTKERQLRDTILQVDKQNQEIQAVITKTEGNEQQISSMTQTIDSIDQQVSSTKEIVDQQTDKVSSLETQVSDIIQGPDSITAKIEKAVTDINGDIDDAKKIATYFDLTEEGLEIKGYDSEDSQASRVSTLMGKDRFAIKIDNNEAMQIYAGLMKIASIVASDSLTLKPITMESYGSGESGGIALKWRGFD